MSQFDILKTYNKRYYLTHPWEVLLEIKRNLVWAWQRVFRGWDDRVIWSIDWYLAEKIPQWMMTLKERKAGIPGRMFNKEDFDSDYNPTKEGMKRATEKWNDILDAIAYGLTEYSNFENGTSHPLKGSYADEQKRVNEEAKKSLELFAENFGSFWD